MALNKDFFCRKNAGRIKIVARRNLKNTNGIGSKKW